MKTYFLLAAATLALVACNNDDHDVDEPVAAHITATIGESAVTRASETSWVEGDQIGITMGDRYTNIKYTIENGEFKGATMYFKNKRDPETLTAYYPFVDSEGTPLVNIEASTSAERQTSAEQPKFDFLYAKEKNVTGSEPNVNFTFFHQMSKLTLIFNNGNDGTDVSKITSYEIEGLVLEGTFNTVTGVCAAKNGAATTPLKIKVTEGTVTSGESVPSLILFPQQPGNDKVKLKITDSEEQEYACTLGFGDGGMVAGNNYQYTITVKKTGVSVNSTIADWIIQPLLQTEASSSD